jgi:hypothetical protein
VGWSWAILLARAACMVWARALPSNIWAVDMVFALLQRFWLGYLSTTGESTKEEGISRTKAIPAKEFTEPKEFPSGGGVLGGRGGAPLHHPEFPVHTSNW